MELSCIVHVTFVTLLMELYMAVPPSCSCTAEQMVTWREVATKAQ